MKQNASEQLRQQHIDADRLFLPVLWGLFIASLGLGWWSDSLPLALTAGAAFALVPTALIVSAPGSLASRMAVAVCLMLFCALNIHQAHGMTELHFGIFVLLAFLLCYQDWRVILAAAATAAVHHLSFNYLQAWGYPAFCFARTGLDIVLLHAAYVVVEAGVLCYLALRLQRHSVAVIRGSATLQATLETMRTSADQVVHGMRSITHASSEVASGSEDMASRASAQAASLAEAAKAMVSLTATVAQNAEHAAMANRLAGSASSVAARGGEVVSGVVETMHSISASSQRIGDIIGVIDGIAFQTNILALNAAVEAARAGEQGRGFAVVASEVRNLAQRSAAAAKEIKQLIGASVEQVEAGSRQVGDAGRTMAEIVASVRQVAEIMAAISSAGERQRVDIEAASRTIAQVEETTRETTALVSQSSSAAVAMHAQATAVAQAVDALRGSEQNGSERLALPA